MKDHTTALVLFVFLPEVTTQIQTIAYLSLSFIYSVCKLLGNAHNKVSVLQTETLFRVHI